MSAVEQRKSAPEASLRAILPIKDSLAYVPYLARQLQILLDAGCNLTVVEDGCAVGSGQALAGALTGAISLVVLEESGGVANARNIACNDVEPDEYVWFLDADDVWSPTTILSIFNEAKHSRAEIICFNARKVSPGGDLIEHLREAERDECINSSDAISLAARGVFTGHLWNKFFHSRVVGDMDFPLVRNHSDLAGVMTFLGRSDSVCFVDQYGYDYVIHQTSLLQSVSYDWRGLLEGVAVMRRLSSSDLLRYREMVVFELIVAFIPVLNMLSRNGDRAFAAPEALSYLRGFTRRHGVLSILRSSATTEAKSQYMLANVSMKVYRFVYVRLWSRKWNLR